MACLKEKRDTGQKSAAGVCYQSPSMNKSGGIVMTSHLTYNWQGASGRIYRYYIYPRHPTITEGQVGNYIYSKRNAEGAWMPIYIGQGDLSIRAHEEHQHVGCINSKGATHIHAHVNANEADRLAEEDDLLAHHSEAYSPNGCNLKAKR